MDRAAASPGPASALSLAPLLATLAHFADGTQGGRLWATLRELLAARLGAAPSGLAELDALGKAPDDPARATALATVIQARAATDPDFSTALDTWRAQDQIRILEQAALSQRLPATVPAAEPAAEGTAPVAERAASGTAEKKDEKKKKNWVRRGLAAGASTAVVALIVALFTQFGNDIYSHLPLVGTDATKSPASGPAKAENFTASASWCCNVLSVEASTGFYWRGGAGAMVTALRSPGVKARATALSQPAGVGLIEIPVQTSGTEPILVSPPKVIIRSRRKNTTGGMIAILPRAGQGEGSAGQYEADVDSADPVTVPVGTHDRQSSYQYVSAGSPDVLTLFVADLHYDCTFDVELTWQERGHRHTRILSNGGKPFRIIGSAGLPWYQGDPEITGGLTRVPAGQPFSRYSPG